MHQRVSETDYHLAPTKPPPEPGEVDVWSLHVMEEGEHVMCRSSRTFLYYLCSPSTVAVAALELIRADGYVDVKVLGPVADDGERLYIKHTLTRKRCDEVFTDGERKLMSAHLGPLIKKGSDMKIGTWSASTVCSVLGLPPPPPGRLIK